MNLNPLPGQTPRFPESKPRRPRVLPHTAARWDSVHTKNDRTAERRRWRPSRPLRRQRRVADPAAPGAPTTAAQPPAAPAQHPRHHSLLSRRRQFAEGNICGSSATRRGLWWSASKALLKARITFQAAQNTARLRAALTKPPLKPSQPCSEPSPYLRAAMRRPCNQWSRNRNPDVDGPRPKHPIS